MARKRKGNWISLRTSTDTTVWLRLRWIMGAREHARDRLSQHGQTVIVPYVKVLYCPPGADAETYQFEGDEMALLLEVLGSRSVMREAA